MHYFEDTSIVRQWLFAVALFVVSFGVLIGLRRVLWRRLKALAAATSIVWDDVLLDALKSPITLLILIGSAAIGAQLAPAHARTHPVVIHGLRILGIVALIWLANRLVTGIFQSKALPASMGGSTRILLALILRVFVITIGLLVVLDSVGVSITPVLASLGVGSVAVALALQDTLSNFFSGIYLLVDKPIRPGDFVQIDSGVEGTVTKIGWRSTHVQLLSNNTVVVPNSKVASSQITNFDLPAQELAVLVKLGVSYGSDLAQVEAVTIDVAKQVLQRVPGAIASFTPFIRYNEFAESSVNFTVILRAEKFVDKYLLTHEFIKALHQRYRLEGIEIPFPQRVVHMQGAQKA